MKPNSHISNDSIIAALRGAPEVQAHLANQAKQIAGERKKLAAELADLEKAAGETNVKNWAETDRAREDRDAAHAALIRANQLLSAATGKQLLESDASRREIEARTNRLCETADPAIEQFIASMWDAYDACRRAPPLCLVETRKNLATGRREETRRKADVMQPGDRLRAIRAAIETAREMKLLPDQSKVADQLAALEAGLPKIGEPK